MNTVINNWHALRIPMLSLTSVVVTCCSLMLVANQYKNNLDLSLEKAKTLYSNTQQKRQLSKLEQQHKERYLPEYQHLLQIGFIGDERRQQWLEQLRQVRAQHHLFHIDYEITPQHLYQPRFIADIENHEIYRSVMTLTFDLLHENDLVHLLTDLHNTTSPFMVRDCEVLRMVEPAINTDKTEGNLKARCEIDWLTLRAKS